ncbi:hypothetical protein GF324_03250, partial [bacterium]|nr:hypothetical protein [bacterium]
MPGPRSRKQDRKPWTVRSRVIKAGYPAQAYQPPQQTPEDSVVVGEGGRHGGRVDLDLAPRGVRTGRILLE